MKFYKRIAAGLALFLGAAGLILSLVAGVGIWFLREPVTERMTHVFARVEAAFEVADQSLGQVKTSLANAEKRLEGVKEEQRKLAKEPKKDSASARLLARTVQKTIGPEVGGAQDKLQTIAEAAVVVNSVLEDLGNFPFLSTKGLDTGSLKKINALLADISPAAWELSRLLGEPEHEADALSQLSRIEGVLKTMQGSIAEYEPQLQQIRQRTEDLKARALNGVSLAPVIISLGCIWIAVAQFSLLCHGLTWWKGCGKKT
jgi:hypothetical protein